MAWREKIVEASRNPFWEPFRLRMCYTGFALNAAVVWCGCSDAIFDLRSPAFSLFRMFSA